MHVLEQIISVIAPHTCVRCDQDGRLVCADCWPEITPKLPSRCYACNSLSVDSKTCKKCRRASKLAHVWVRTAYDGFAKELIHGLKFERKRSAAEVIAAFLAEVDTKKADSMLIVPVPTATSRRRQRGYDQAELIARSYSQQTNQSYAPLLLRDGQSRQVGADRKTRKDQLKQAFWVTNAQRVVDAEVLLIDDVITTGATLEAAAEVLKRAGAKQVNAVVFAQTKL